jgi:uncharacterized Zn finger protein
MTNLPQLSEADIHGWTDPRSFGRGQRYYHSGHIINPRRQGDTLKARCIGSRPQPYRVEITLGRDGIAYGECSCPVGAGGHCKHAVALLLTWLHESSTFTVVEDLKTALERLSKSELIVLIQRMLDRYPDLETVLELPIVGETEEAPPVNADVIQRQAQGAFAGIGYDDWVDVRSIADQLLQLVDIGDDYVEIGQWRDAATIYQTVMDEALDGYGMLHDETGYLNEVVDRCVEGLEGCLVATEDPFRREMLLQALFHVYRWDMDFGGIDMGYRAPDIILELATPEEKRQVSAWVREALSSDGSRWARQAYGHLLLQLEEAWLDDQAFLQFCRETGRREDLVERLLVLDRVEEAIEVARRANDYELLCLADVFLAQDHSDLAERLIRERLRSTRDRHLTGWLKERALARGDQEEALALAEGLFWERPSLRGYEELRTLARPLERWNDLRAAILSRLAEEEKRTLLIEIHLEENEVDHALEILEQMRGTPRRRWAVDHLILQVAQAAEEERPREAIRLYKEAAEQLIARRGRGNYAVAASYLTRARDIHGRLDETWAWTTYIAELRASNPRLRALKDELNKAGL